MKVQGDASFTRPNTPTANCVARMVSFVAASSMLAFAVRFYMPFFCTVIVPFMENVHMDDDTEMDMTMYMSIFTGSHTHVTTASLTVVLTVAGSAVVMLFLSFTDLVSSYGAGVLWACVVDVVALGFRVGYIGRVARSGRLDSWMKREIRTMLRFLAVAGLTIAAAYGLATWGHGGLSDTWNGFFNTLLIWCLVIHPLLYSVENTMPHHRDVGEHLRLAFWVFFDHSTIFPLALVTQHPLLHALIMFHRHCHLPFRWTHHLKRKSLSSP